MRYFHFVIKRKQEIYVINRDKEIPGQKMILNIFRDIEYFYFKKC